MTSPLPPEDLEEFVITHHRWSDAALEQFAKRVEAFFIEDAAWKTEARRDLDSLLKDKTMIIGGKTALLWVAAGIAAVASAWTWIASNFHITPK